MKDMAPSLDQLRQLPLPPPPDWWPRTWAWAALFLAVAVFALYFGVRTIRRHRRDRYRREALRHLDHIQSAASIDRTAARSLPSLLKRAELSRPGGADVRSLRGQAWVAYLDRTGPGPFPEGTAEWLTVLAYGRDRDIAAIPAHTLAELFQASRRWLEHRHVAT